MRSSFLCTTVFFRLRTLAEVFVRGLGSSCLAEPLSKDREMTRRGLSSPDRLSRELEAACDLENVKVSVRDISVCMRRFRPSRLRLKRGLSTSTSFCSCR